MESTSWPESLPSNRIQAMEALTQGQELMDILREMLWLPKMVDSSSTEAQDHLVVQILGMLENTLSIMSSSSNESVQFVSSELHSPCSSDEQKSKNSNKSLKPTIPVKVKRGCYKRRKNSWTSTQVASVLVDDGHAWRKYGQKRILNSKHQRSYYRCTYKFDQGCEATKQVQQIQDNPQKFKTTYLGNHTCKYLQREPTIILDSLPDPRDTSILLSFGTKDLVEKKQVDQSNFRPIKHEQNEGFHSMGNSLQNAKPSFKSYPSFDSNIKRPLEPIPMTSSILDDKYMAYDSYMAPNSHNQEMDHMFERNDFNDFPYELCF